MEKGDKNRLLGAKIVILTEEKKIKQSEFQAVRLSLILFNIA